MDYRDLQSDKEEALWVGGRGEGEGMEGLSLEWYLWRTES